MYIDFFLILTSFLVSKSTIVGRKKARRLSTTGQGAQEKNEWEGRRSQIELQKCALTKINFENSFGFTVSEFSSE